MTEESVTQLWYNPPYDNDRHRHDKRLELAFLKSTAPKQWRSGILMTNYLLVTDDVMRHIWLFQVCDLFLSQFNIQSTNGIF